MRLLLARHAESQANVEHVIACGIPGPHLTRLGHDQAIGLADRLQDEGVTAIYHSRMVRTVETAAPLAERLRLPMIELPGLHEVDLGDVAERSDKEAYELMDALATEWNLHDRLDGSRPGGETGLDVVRRMHTSFDDIRARHGGSDDVVLAVAHGLCLRTSVQRWGDGVGLEFAFRNLLPNASVIEIDVPDDPVQRPVVLSWAGLDPSQAPASEGGVL